MMSPHLSRFAYVACVLCLVLVVVQACGDEAALQERYQAALDKLEAGSSSYEEVGAELAAELGEDAVAFLRQKALQEAGDSRRLSIETLKHLPPRAAAQALHELARADAYPTSRLAVEALIELPGEEAKAAIEGIACAPGERNRRTAALECLLWRGDKVTLSKVTDGIASEQDEQFRPLLEFAQTVLSYRLTELETDEEKSAWEECARDLWQAERKAAQYRSFSMGVLRVGPELHEKREFPFELLRLYVEDAPRPSAVAMLLMGLQREEQAVPILRKCAEDQGEIGKIAQTALDMITESAD